MSSGVGHPIFTARGWQAAQSLQQGDEVYSLAQLAWLKVERVAQVAGLLEVDALKVEAEGYGAGALGIWVANSNIDCVWGLDEAVHAGQTKFNDWVDLNINKLEYKGKTGRAAAEELAKDLTPYIKDKKVLEVLKDSQGRFSIVVETDGITHDLITVQKNVDGDDIITRYNRAYNPNAKPSIDVGASANRLVPDYTRNMAGQPSTQYLYPPNLLPPGKSPVVRIKMSGKRNGSDGDFHRANREAGIENQFGTAPPDKYTWHHMDDLEVDSNGDVWCKMQLVKSDAHTRIDGMAHSGSVAQWKAYFVNSTKAPLGRFYSN